MGHESKQKELEKEEEELSMADSSSKNEPEGEAISTQENRSSEAWENSEEKSQTMASNPEEITEELVKKSSEVPTKILQNSTISDEASASIKKKNQELIMENSSTVSIEGNLPNEETEELLVEEAEIPTKEDLREAMELFLCAYEESQRMQRNYERHWKMEEVKRKILHSVSISDEPSTWNKMGISIPEGRSNLESLREKLKSKADLRRGQKIMEQIIARNNNLVKRSNSNEAKGKKMKQKMEDPDTKEDESRKLPLLRFLANANGLKISEGCSDFQAVDDLAKSLVNMNVQLDAVKKRSEFLMTKQMQNASQEKGHRKNEFPATTPGETSIELIIDDGSKGQECSLSDGEIDEMIEELIWIGNMMISKGKDIGKKKEPEA